MPHLFEEALEGEAAHVAGGGKGQRALRQHVGRGGGHFVHLPGAVDADKLVALVVVEHGGGVLVSVVCRQQHRAG